ncbi:lytic polysaccharide monooxygenase [Chromobacterium sp. IIBBL 290-4]|uniref:lytic polysaccharide monooxygenase n=1 Tax=Chromobacterium sp. IIBBL 290-4 TaxID=2953890 RepID=UPI0020B7FF8D|nr:lytic polysaccharide monooxygenase [Chromobacterium sp. IIBBL 290-4]UTH76259.1 lytic polysaccharide monooxygenase [Chromobacterium sp. IIBBL 290-4]
MKLRWSGPLLVLLTLPHGAWAHGTMEVPINRVYSCFLEDPEEPKTPACQAVQKLDGTEGMYNWNGINQNPPGDKHQAVVSDGQLCGGGQSTFRSFNLPRQDWKSSRMVPDANGNFEFIYRATAPHATKYFRFYITKNGWNPAQPLKWSDLELFGAINGNPPQDANKRYHMTLKLPPGKTGPHIIYNVWKRSDSEEAFYSCSDVVFDGNTSQPPLANPWKEIGQIAASRALPAGSRVTLRVFDAQGHDAESHTVTLDRDSGQAGNWPYLLAQKVNQASRILRIGALKQQGRQAEVQAQSSARDNRIYLNEGYAGYSYSLDRKLPD